MNSDRDYALHHYGYPNPLKCERCGRIIYADDNYKKSGYGGFLCADCINDEDFDYEEDEENEGTF